MMGFLKRNSASRLHLDGKQQKTRQSGRSPPFSAKATAMRRPPGGQFAHHRHAPLQAGHPAIADANLRSYERSSLLDRAIKSGDNAQRAALDISREIDQFLE
jgi:hypothetical protein